MSETPSEILRETQSEASPPKRFAKLRALPFALAALFAVVAAIAGCAYAISAWQVYGFASRVWDLPAELCFAAAIVADLLSLAGLFATYLLRKAKIPVQLYAWFVFLVMTGLSIGAAESYASWRFADPWNRPDVTFDARVASAAIVIALALAVHLLILCRNHLTLPTETEPEVPVAPAPKPAPQPKAEPAPVVRKERPEVGKAQVKPPATRPAAPRKDAGKDEIPEPVARVLAGEKPAAVAKDLGKSTRTVQIRVQKWREQHPDPVDPANAVPEMSRLFHTEGPRLPGVPTSTNARPINGAAPEVEVTK